MSACGGGSDSPTTDPDPSQKSVKTGVFLDSPVIGIGYETATKSGFTNTAGQYEYLEGETVTFSLGDIILGSALAGPVVTPVDLVPEAGDSTDPAVRNIIRLLITLDADDDPSNGIDVSAAHAAGTGSSVDVHSATFEADVAQLIIAVKGPGVTLVDEETAIAHFNESQQTRWGSSVWGSDCWSTVCS